MGKILSWLHQYFFNRWLIILSIDMLFLLISFYAIWGWLTVSDVKTYAHSKNLDESKIMTEIFRLNCSYDYVPKDDNIAHYIDNIERFFPVRRFAKNETTYYKDGNLQKKIEISSIISLLYLFLILSPSVSNFFFCFGIGYLISIVLVMSKMLTSNDTMSTTYLILRPIGGGMSSCCLLLIVISGGNLLWENPSNFKGLSLGTLATIGALYCGNIRTFLDAIVKHSHENNSKK